MVLERPAPNGATRAPDAKPNCGALLIGVDEYASLGAVKYAERDATAFAEALRDYCGFSPDNVCLMKQGGRRRDDPVQRVVEARIRALRDSKIRWDLLVVGFWGHGFVGPNGKRYLCAADADENDLERTAISLEAVQSALVQTGATNTVLILDCCRNVADRAVAASSWTERDDAELARVTTRDVVAAAAKKFPAFARPAPRFATLNACSVGQRAVEWDEREHGLFTACLLDALKDGLFAYSELTRRLSERVPEIALRLNRRQTPSFRLEGDGDLRLDLPRVRAAEPRIGARTDLPTAAEPRIGARTDLPTAAEPESSGDLSAVALRRFPIEPVGVDVLPKFLPERFCDARDADGRPILPPVSEEIRRIRAEIAGIDDALRALSAETHSALKPARAALEGAAAQYRSIANRRNAVWAALPKNRRALLEEAIQTAPRTAPPSEFYDLKPAGASPAAFARLVGAEKKRLEAKDVEKETGASFRRVLTDATSTLTERKRRQTERLRPFADEVLGAVLATLPGYRDPDSAFPESAFDSRLPLLEDFRLDRSDAELRRTAAERWNVGRPCVDAARERREEETRMKKRLAAEDLKKRNRIDAALSYVVFAVAIVGGVVGIRFGIVGFLIGLFGTYVVGTVAAAASGRRNVKRPPTD